MKAIKDETQAQLFRFEALAPGDPLRGEGELVGEGRFDKMVRLALTDPDDEVWRYEIEVFGHFITGDAIRQYLSADDRADP